MAHLPADTALGPVHLRVADLERGLSFYRDVLGLHPQPATAAPRTRVTLSANDGRPLVVLSVAPNPRPRPRPSTGLYHFAILLPHRVDLGATLRRLFETRYPVQGASDHGVSEALYLADPDDNGIEIYRDRPRAEWPYEDGELAMVTEPFDTEGVLAEVSEDRYRWGGLPAGARIGHIHLHVRDLDEAQAFYTDVLGFDLVQRYPPAVQAPGRASAAFLSVGGYHHHLGINTWAGAGAPPPPADAVGLEHFVLRLPDALAFDAVCARLAAAGVSHEVDEQGLLVRDPSGNATRITCATS